MAPQLLKYKGNRGFQMNKLTLNILKSALTLSTVALLTACGSNNQPQGTDFSSRLPVDQIVDSNKAIAYCNQASNSSITVRTQSYTENNTVRMDYVFARITQLPSSFTANDSYIAMWRWMANASGQSSLDQTPLSFRLTLRSNGQVLTDWKTTLRWSDVSSVATSYGYNDASAFFNNVNILVNLRDVQGDYDALKVSLYSTSNVTLSQVDSLLPPFHANPAHYAVDSYGAQRASILQNLHPFKSMSTATDFRSIANSYCLN